MPPLRDKNGLTEDEFLRQYNGDKYPKPSVTADIAVFRMNAGVPELLLIRRGGHPFLGSWALPGGFANRNEPLEKTAARELQEETGIVNAELILVGVYSEPGRDPRGWTVSAAYAALLSESTEAAAGDDAAEAMWFPLERGSDGSYWLPCRFGRLAFDHDQIVRDACAALLKDLPG